MPRRTAIGASRSDIVTQLVLEASWFAAVGLALGLVLTMLGMKLVSASVPPSLSEYVVRPQTSWRMFAMLSDVSWIM